MTPTVRPYRAADALALGWVFHRAVRDGAAAFYSEEERRAWARDEPEAARWRARLRGSTTFVCDGAQGPVGFMSLRPDGCLDLAYVTPEAMGTGVAGALYDRVEAEASARGIATLTVEASHLARRFLLKRGWVDVCAQTVERHRVKLRNFQMKKPLSTDDSHDPE